MIHFSQAEIDRFIEEDLPYHDETTHALGIAGHPGELMFSAKSEGFVLCGVEEAVRIAQSLGAEVETSHVSGDWISPGAVFLMMRGRAEVLHRAWKVSLTLMETASGVATRTRAMLDAARAVNPSARIATTRKAPPGLRKLMFKAVLAGGGMVHRAGLSETLLVFEQHRAFLPPDEPLKHTLTRLHRASPEKKIMIEAETLDEALQAAAAGADVVQIEKMAPERLAEVVATLRARYPGLVISATGGIRLDNAAAYAGTGVDLLVTSHPYHAPPVDIRASMRPAPVPSSALGSPRVPDQQAGGEWIMAASNGQCARDRDGC